MSANVMSRIVDDKRTNSGVSKPSVLTRTKPGTAIVAGSASSDPRKTLTNGDPPKLMLWGSED